MYLVNLGPEFYIHGELRLVIERVSVFVITQNKYVCVVLTANHNEIRFEVITVF